MWRLFLGSLCLIFYESAEAFIDIAINEILELSSALAWSCLLKEGAEECIYVMLEVRNGVVGFEFVLDGADLGVCGGLQVSLKDDCKLSVADDPADELQDYILLFPIFLLPLLATLALLLL